MELIKKLFHEFGGQRTGVTLEGGGEPTLHPQFQKIVEAGRETNVDMGLISNGTVDISEYVNKLNWVRISLDSSTKEEYKREKGVDCFEQVLRNLEKMSKLREPAETFCWSGLCFDNKESK